MHRLVKGLVPVIRTPIVLTPVILRPWLLTARRKFLSSLRPSNETPITILKLFAIVCFFWTIANSGQSMGRSILLERGLTRIQGMLLIANIWVFLGVVLYSFALPLSLNELFLSPDRDLISASPYPRLKKLFGILLGLGLKILPTSLILMIPAISFTKQLISLGTFEVILASLIVVYLPCSLAVLSSLIFMSLVPSREVIKMGAPIALALILILPIGAPQFFNLYELSTDLRELLFNSVANHNLGTSLVTVAAQDLHNVEQIITSRFGDIFQNRTLVASALLASAVIPVAICLLISYPLYGAALSGSSRLQSIHLPSIKVTSRPASSFATFITSVIAKFIKITITLFSSSRSLALNEAPLHEKFIKAFLRQELLTIIRDPFRLLHLALLMTLSLIYLSAMPSILDSSRFLVEFSSVINFTLVSFLVASFANRFVITSFSREGEANWIVYSSPLTSGQVMLSKFLAWCMLLIPSGIFLGITGCLLMQASLTHTVLVTLVIGAGIPSIVSSALTTGLRLRPMPGSSSGPMDMTGSSYGIVAVFAMVVAATIIFFNGALFLMAQLAPNQAISFFWISIFLLLNFVFTKARLSIGVGRFNEQAPVNHPKT